MYGNEKIAPPGAVIEQDTPLIAEVKRLASAGARLGENIHFMAKALEHAESRLRPVLASKPKDVVGGDCATNPDSPVADVDILLYLREASNRTESQADHLAVQEAQLRALLDRLVI